MRKMSSALSVFAVSAMVLCCLGESSPSSHSNPPIQDTKPVDGPNPPTGGDPVGYIDGSVYDSVEDLRVSCPDIDLAFRRAYCSVSDRSGSLGFRWRHSYEWRLEAEDGEVSVYVAGESGPSEAVHVFEDPPEGSEVWNSDGYKLSREPGGGYVMTAPNAISYAFSPSGRLLSATTWNGTSVALEYGGQNSRLSRAVHSCGKSLYFEYDADGLLTRVTTPDSNVWVEVAVGSLWSHRVLERVVRHDGMAATTNSYSYGKTPMPGFVDELRARIAALEAAGVVEDDGGFVYEDSGGTGIVNVGGTGSAGQTLRMLRQRLENAMLRYGSSYIPLLYEKTDANGIATQYSYVRPDDGPSAQCVGTVMSGGLFETELSFGDGVTAELKPIAGGVAETRLFYDARQRETERIVGAESLSKEYDGSGDLVRECRTNATTGAYVDSRRAYDSRHRLISSGAALNATPARFATLSWDERRGIPNRVVSPGGRVTEWTTNGVDITVYGAGTNDTRLVSQILMTTNERPETVISPDGVHTVYSYDESGYATNVCVDGKPSVSLGYDLMGNVNAVTIPGSDGTPRETSFVNNWRGRPLSIAHPDGTAETFEYNGKGRCAVRHVDALGREDVYKWVLGLPVHAGRVIGGVTNTLFGVEHDQQLNVVAIVDPLGRRAETYVLDENERVVAVTNVEGQAMTRTYAVGRLVSSETRFDGTEVAYGYDEDGNLSSVEYPGETLAFRYDGDGLMLSASNVAGVVSNGYDASTGWLDETRGADGTTVAYARRNGGGVSAMTSVAGTTSYSCDIAGRRAGIVSPAGTFGFSYCDWNGRLAAVTNSHGLVTEYQYDIMDRVTNIAWRTSSGATLGGFTYEYDAIGRITSRSHSLGTSAFDRIYAYDDLDRLASDGDVAYTYDAAGNRMTRTEEGETITYTLGVGDRLASWTGGSYTYDAAGNVTQIVRTGRPTLDLTWNSRYQLVSVATNGVFAEGYAYDALGRRVSTTTFEGTVRHVYDDNWQCIADLDEQGNVIASYVWGDGIDRLLAVKVGGATYYPLTDIQGTIWGYVDANNDIVAQWQYDAWGNVVSKSVVVPALALLRYRFQGREWSAATGLINFRMRWYDAETGRWLSKDPIGLSGGLNLYVFCLDKPNLIRDPYGLDKEEDDDNSDPDKWKDVGEGVANAFAEMYPYGEVVGALPLAAVAVPFAQEVNGWKAAKDALLSGALEDNDKYGLLEDAEEDVRKGSRAVDSAMKPPK